MKNTENIISFIKSHNLSSPIKLQIGLHKLANRLASDGNQKRYFKVYAKCDNYAYDITKFVSESTGLSYSLAKDTYGCVIISGCGMDMAFQLISLLNQSVYEYGVDLFDTDTYEYLGKWSHGKYNI